jgi:hypothetical protein
LHVHCSPNYTHPATRCPEQLSINDTPLACSPSRGAKGVGASWLGYEYLFTVPKQVAAWELLLKFGEAFLRETPLEFQGRDVVEVF